VYLAKAGKVEIVDLNAPGGPEAAGSLDLDGGLITCMEAHGDYLYVCTLARKLYVYALGRTTPDHRVAELTLARVGQRIRAHGRTVHVGELGVARYMLCTLGGPCDQGGEVEVLWWGDDGVLSRVSTYPMGVPSLPYLELSGEAAIKPAAGGIEVYRVESAP
jgi:hypothetical protein